MDILTTYRVLYSGPTICGYEAMQSCRQPVTSSLISFVGSPAIAGESKEKTHRRIDSFRFFIPPSMTVKEETSDGLTATTEQTSITRQHEETNVEPQLNHRPPTEHDEPNSQPWLADFELGVSEHKPMSFRFPKRQFGKSKPVSKNVQVAWFDSRRWLHYVEDEDTVICHTCASAGDINVRCSLHHQMLHKLGGCHTNEGRLFATWNMASVTRKL